MQSDTAVLRAVVTLVDAGALLNPSAKLITSAYSKIDASLLLDARPYQAPEQPHYLSEDEIMTTEDFDIGTDVLHDPRPFHPQRLYSYYRNDLAPGILN